jgi:alpha-beta hydrolase superfamily lysophospholipase
MTGALRAVLVAVVAALLLAGGGPSVSAQTGRGTMRTMTIRTTDGRTLTALHAEAEQRPAPAVVLVPMLGRPREDWQPLIERLIAANMSALLVDLPAATAPGEPKELASWQAVVHGGLEYLAGRPEVRGGSIGVAGASLGANLAALAASGDSRVRSLALLSPSLDYRGVRIEGALRQYGERPALLLASLKDPYAARSARSLAGGAAGVRELLWSEVPAHGTLLLANQPELARTLVEWFQRTLG